MNEKPIEGVPGCDREGHPKDFWHGHPYVTALCVEARNPSMHAVCATALEITGTTGACDCPCHLDAHIDALHGPGAARAIEEAYADGSIFSDSGES